MSRLRFDFDWRNAPGSADAAVRHSMADLGIWIDGKSVTRVFDRQSRSIRDTVFVSLYPLAEWVAAHWWPLLEENKVSQRGGLASFQERHCLAYAGDGFALPRLTVISEGEAILLQWTRSMPQHQAVEFVDSGEVWLQRDEVRDAMSDLVRAVLARLAACDVSDTWLSNEWEALSEGEPEESDFCRAAAWLGLDPFDLSEDVSKMITEAVSRVPGGLFEDTLRSCSSSFLRPACDWLSRGMEMIRDCNLSGRSLGRLKTPPWRGGPLAPWKQGYQMARDLRANLGLPDRAPVDLEGILGDCLPVIRADKPPLQSLNGLVGAVNGGGFCCYTARTRKESLRFVVARALGLFLDEGRDMPALLSEAITQKQKRNRAFAAEFLAPAQMLKSRLPSEMISSEDVEDLASEFEVSSYVIGHQIRNHQLAGIIDADSSGESHGFAQ